MRLVIYIRILLHGIYYRSGKKTREKKTGKIIVYIIEKIWHFCSQFIWYLSRKWFMCSICDLCHLTDYMVVGSTLSFMGASGRRFLKYDYRFVTTSWSIHCFMQKVYSEWFFVIYFLLTQFKVEIYDIFQNDYDILCDPQYSKCFGWLWHWNTQLIKHKFSAMLYNRIFFAHFWGAFLIKHLNSALLNVETNW